MAKKARRTVKAEPELLGMPPPDELVKKGRHYIQMLADAETAKDAKDKAAIEFVAMMREKKRGSLRIDGAIITVKHREAADLIKVSHPKEP